MGSPNFRAGVVIIVRGLDDRLLAFERGDVPGQWQLPQGGLDVNETPVAAAWRELHEETGLAVTMSSSWPSIRIGSATSTPTK